jgi:hypothetical protein
VTVALTIAAGFAVSSPPVAAADLDKQTGFQISRIELPYDCADADGDGYASPSLECAGNTVAFFHHDSPTFDGAIQNGNGDYFATGLWSVRPNPGLNSGWGSFSLVTVDRAKLGVVDVAAIPAFKQPVGDEADNKAFLDFLNTNDRGIVNLWLTMPGGWRP